MDPLRDYYDGLHEAPIPARLLAETPPQAMLRKMTIHLAWAAAALALVALVVALPTAKDPQGAAMAARSLRQRVALRSEVER